MTNTISAMQRNWKSGIAVLACAMLAGYCMVYTGKAELEHEAFVAKTVADAATAAELKIEAERAYQKCLHPDGNMAMVGLGKEFCDKLREKEGPEEFIKPMRSLHY